MFKKILIANRGEIACRVIRTAKHMGIKTVAVCSTADLDGVHVRQADEHYVIGPPPSSQSYLKGDEIIKVMLESGAQAVHPGYGFLSENSSFAKQVAKAGLVFIGPGPKAIEVMGDKVTSKKLAQEAGVNVIPGTIAVMKTVEDAVALARYIGYPVMIKAAAGGGGKGMRVAFDDKEVKRAFQSATNEARSSFGDSRLFIEKFVENPRHIEIQILADSHGNTIYLGERECSIQRRHQKVIEEAPSPFVDDSLRASMGSQSVQLARQVGYISAGTVEFIVDDKKNFYFLEMNTRLQVEHPVTELVTGIDLVEQMINIAAGEKLAISQGAVKLNGSAIEARIYAEDPSRGFLPSSGRVVAYDPPENSPNVRVDTGINAGSQISIYYDPMIAKLCTWDKTRDQAISHMKAALDRFYLRGLSHNMAFLSSLVQHERFHSGDISTAFLDQEYADGYIPPSLTKFNAEILTSAAVIVHVQTMRREASVSGQLAGHEAKVGDDWVVINDARQEWEVHCLPDRLPGEGIGSKHGSWRLRHDKKVVEVEANWQPGQQLIIMAIRGNTYAVQIESLGVGYRLHHGGAVAEVVVLRRAQADLYHLMPVRPVPDMSRYLLSPMPGLLVSIAVKEGQEVDSGDELAVVEAMKMENVLCAERPGVVDEINVSPGDSLEVDQTILTFQASTDKD